MKTYTQRDEQKYILELCATAKRKRVLDIGAWAPLDKSNSRALIESGWGAVLIEPSPGPLRELVKEYGQRATEKYQDVIVLSGAVGCEAGITPIVISDDAISSSVRSHVDTWRNHAEFLGTLYVPTFTIRQVLERFGDFDCVSIDTEGTSLDVFRDLVTTEMFPRCIVVEHDGREGEAIHAAQARGYRVHYRSEENLVFGI